MVELDVAVMPFGTYIIVKHPSVFNIIFCSSIDREHVVFCSESPFTDQIDTLRTTVEQCVEFTSPLHLDFIDFEKISGELNKECIWNALRSRMIPQKLMTIKAVRCDYEIC